ncbi:MAG: transporter substrate-binding protein [Herbaspirillum sp.]|nr:transporter substrate-binding protein [Herbaspirillum sp.]
MRASFSTSFHAYLTSGRILRALAAMLALSAATIAGAQTLHVGLAEDIDMLDPTASRSFVGRIVFASLCDKLFDIDEKLAIVPQLATSYQWSPDNKVLTLKLRPGVTFQDGEKFDAAAVKFNIERAKNMQTSSRKSELAPVESVQVVDDTTVKLNLSAPFSPLVSVLADRAGMMVSPKAAKAHPTDFANNPVCSGPFKFKERVAQDHIVLERYAGYWNNSAIHFDKVIFQPIVDASVRLANLRSGQLDIIERLASSDVAGLKAENKFSVASFPLLGYAGININVGKSDVSQKNPLGRDPRVREAFELSLDRAGIVQVAADGQGAATNQWVAPSNPFYAKNDPIPKRNIARAKELLKEAGVPHPSFTLMTPTDSDAQKIAQVIQAMSSEAGFNMKIQSTEFGTTYSLSDTGQFDAQLRNWSGRVDPDGNVYPFYACKQSENWQGYCKAEVDDLLKKSRSTPDVAQRVKLYEQVAAEIVKDRPIIYLYNRNGLWAYNKKLTGVRPIPDGLIRVQGLKM